MEWNPINERLAYARFKCRLFNISVISEYFPTLDSDEMIKDNFFDSLQDLTDHIPSRDHLVVAGDWNARTGRSDISTRHLIGH